MRVKSRNLIKRCHYPRVLKIGRREIRVAEKQNYTGELLVKEGIISNDQLKSALEIQKQQSSNKFLCEILREMGVCQSSMQRVLDRNKKMPIGQVLVKKKYISENQLEQALETQLSCDKRLGDILLEKGFITYNSLRSALSQHFNMPRIPYEDFLDRQSNENFYPLSRDYCLKNNVIVLDNSNEGNISLGITDPKPALLEDLVRFVELENKQVKFYLAEESDLGDATDNNKGLKYMSKNGSQGSDDTKKDRLESKRATRLLDQVVERAISVSASDIHLMPAEYNVTAKIRIDGLLQELTLPEDFSDEYSAIVSRVKVLTDSMKIEEKVVL